jgi:hypothetical protein
MIDQKHEAVARALSLQIVETLSDGWGDAENVRAAIEIYPAILAALEAVTAESGMEWQPIESAPKDGTEVLLGAERWVYQGRYLPDSQEWFAINNDPNDYWGGELLPTHWRPLPAPPAAKEPAQAAGT